MPDEPVIRIKCPDLRCQRLLAVPALARGKLVRCKNCGTTIRIPAKSQQATPTDRPVGQEANDAAA